MQRKHINKCLVLLGIALHYGPLSDSVRAVTFQSPFHLLPDGQPYLWVEAESAAELSNSDSTGFTVVGTCNPIQTRTSYFTGDPPVENIVVKGGLDVLPTDTNASRGSGIFDQIGGALGADTATWELQFVTPGRYYLYLHYSLFNSDTNTNYSNEDSVFLPPAFNLNSTTDWIGFEGEDEFGDPKTGAGSRSGWMPMFKDIVSNGVVETHNDTNEDFWDGQFHWSYMNTAVEVDADNGFVDDFGQAIFYDVKEADLGQTLTFEISTREAYTAIDALLFVTDPELLLFNPQETLGGVLVQYHPSNGGFGGKCQLGAEDINELTRQSASGENRPEYDLTGDGLVDAKDVREWIRADDIFFSWLGDANLDGEFNSDDLIEVLAASTYEKDVEAVWTTGDFNGSGRFDTNDLIDALADQGYEKGLRQNVASVPEPSSLLLGVLACTMLLDCRRLRRSPR